MTTPGAPSLKAQINIQACRENVRTPCLFMNSAFPLADLQKNEAMTPERVVGAVRQSKTELGFPLGDPTLRWVAALYDPRQCYEEASIPTEASYSEKIHVYSRGTFNSGTTGIGCIAVAANGAANDAVTVKASTNTTVMTSATLFAAATNLATANSNSQFASAAFGVGPGKLVQRCVGMALYVKYAGTELNRGGDYLLFEEPAHGDISNASTGYSYTLALGQDGCKRPSITNDWVHVAYVPNSSAECGFGSTAGNAVFGSNQVLAIFVNSAGASQQFEYEYNAWYEIVGSPARAATISFADPIGFAVVQAAGTMYQQLDCVLGLDGFMRAIHAQQRNQSGVLSVGAPHGNWAGLLAFLPGLAALLEPVARSAAGAASRWLDQRAQPKPSRPRNTAINHRTTVELVSRGPTPKKTKPKPKQLIMPKPGGR